MQYRLYQKKITVEALQWVMYIADNVQVNEIVTFADWMHLHGVKVGRWVAADQIEYWKQFRYEKQYWCTTPQDATGIFDPWWKY